MSYFIYISVEDKIEALTRHFSDSFSVISAEFIPAGAAMIAGRENQSVVLITSDGCSTNLMDAGPKKKKYAQLFLEKLEAVVEEFGFVSVVVHLSRGNINLEQVTLGERIKLLYSDFREIFPGDVELDTRYSITK